MKPARPLRTWDEMWNAASPGRADYFQITRAEYARQSRAVQSRCPRLAPQPGIIRAPAIGAPDA